MIAKQVDVDPKGGQKMKEGIQNDVQQPNDDEEESSGRWGPQVPGGQNEKKLD